MCRAVGGPRLFLNREAPLPVERFPDHCPLVPLPTISRKNVCVENELICIVNHLLGGVDRGAGIGVCDCVIDLPPDNLYGVCGGIFLVEALAVCDPVGVGDEGVGLVEVGDQIQCAGSAISLVRPVFLPHQ